MFPGSRPDVSDVYVVAPFWSDVDVSHGYGGVFYCVFTDGDELDSVSNFLTNQTGSGFSGTWMLVAQWNQVPLFAGSGVSYKRVVSRHSFNAPAPIIICIGAN